MESTVWKGAVTTVEFLEYVTEKLGNVRMVAKLVGGNLSVKQVKIPFRKTNTKKKIVHFLMFCK